MKKSASLHRFHQHFSLPHSLFDFADYEGAGVVVDQALRNIQGVKDRHTAVDQNSHLGRESFENDQFIDLTDLRQAEKNFLFSGTAFIGADIGLEDKE